VAVPVLVVSDASVGTWSVMVPILVAYGVGRGVWETLNKAVLVDFYSEDGFDKNAGIGYGGAL
jgi:hypothetical protein